MAVNRGGSCNPGLLKAALGLVAVCIGGYILGPPLYWHLLESCPPCTCHCSSHPLLSIAIPQELRNSSFADCVKRDPDVSEAAEKNFAELLSEEVKLREAEALGGQQRADMSLLEAKKMTSQYQKEADKCNSGMETCEEAREKAEATLSLQKRFTKIWEQRARIKGWREGPAKSRAQSQGNLQAVK